MNEYRFLNVTTIPCGCVVSFDTLYWKPRALEQCTQHKRMMISLALGLIPFDLIEEVHYHA